MLRLLRRIVVLGQTPQLDDLYKKWKDAKKAVEQVEQKIKALIAELKTIDSPTAKDAATQAETNVKAVVAVVQKVREEKDPTQIDNVVQKAKTDLETTVKKAKETVTKAVETAKKAEERSKLPAKTLIYATADDKIYKISGESVDLSSLFFEKSVAGLPSDYIVLFG